MLCRGSKTSSSAAGAGHDVLLERDRLVEGDRRREGDVVLRHVAVLVEPFAVGQRDLGACRPEFPQPGPAADVLPEVDDVTLRSELTDRHRAERLDATDGRCRRRAQFVVSVVDDIGAIPFARVPCDAATEIVHLARDEVGREDVARRRPPGRVGAEHDRLPGYERHDELREQRGRRAVVVDTPGDAVLPPPPAVAEQSAHDVFTVDDQIGDVVRLHLEAFSVRGPARCQFVIADTTPVEEALVDAVSRRVETSAFDRRADRNRAGEQVRRSLQRRLIVELGGRDPPRDPVRAFEQAVLPRARLGPVALAGVGPRLDLPLDGETRLRRDADRDPGRLRRLDPAGIPVARDDPIRVLRSRVGRELPRDAW